MSAKKKVVKKATKKVVKKVAKKSAPKKVKKAASKKSLSPRTASAVVKKMKQTGATKRVKKIKSTQQDIAIKRSLPAGTRKTASPHKHQGRTVKKSTTYTERRVNRSDRTRSGE